MTPFPRPEYTRLDRYDPGRRPVDVGPWVFVGIEVANRVDVHHVADGAAALWTVFRQRRGCQR